MSWAKILLLALPFISNVKGVCHWNGLNKSGLYAVNCICTQQNQVLVMEADNSDDYANVHSLEIRGCKNVSLLPGVFSKAKSLRAINISETDNLYLDPGLALPVSLESLHLSKIGFLSRWLAPEPNAALLSSLKSLRQLYLENVTVPAPQALTSSTFIDLPITKVYMIGIHFIGALPLGTLEFNPRSLSEFNAIDCHFGDLHNGSLLVNASIYANVIDCTFGKVDSGAVELFGKHMAVIGNSFLCLEDTNAILIHGKSKLTFSANIIKIIGGPSALELEVDHNARTDIHGNQLPCSYFGDEMIWKWYEKFGNSDCDASSCTPLQQNHCVHANGQKETLKLPKNESITVLEYNASQHIVSSFGHCLCLFIFCIIL